MGDVEVVVTQEPSSLGYATGNGLFKDIQFDIIAVDVLIFTMQTILIAYFVIDKTLPFWEKHNTADSLFALFDNNLIKSVTVLTLWRLNGYNTHSTTPNLFYSKEYLMMKSFKI